jgi:hypothetical protein
MDDGRNVIDVYRMDGVTLVAGSTVLDDGQRQAPAAGPTVRAGETRGSGPRWNHWPADLPFVHYITADGGRLCVTCANGGNGSRAADADIDPTCPDDRQWHVIGAQTEPEPHACDHCARLIPPSPTKGGPA